MHRFVYTTRMSAAKDPEVATITAIIDALLELADTESRRRVLSYVLSRFAPDELGRAGESNAKAIGNSTSSVGPVTAIHQPNQPAQENEIAGIARLTDSGELKITIRDLKARSGLDAAVRLAHVAIYAYEKLTGAAFSSRQGLTPILREWRLYDGNSRSRLAKEKGILRDGDELRLDAHSRRDAEKYITEILDASMEGTWRPR